MTTHPDTRERIAAWSRSAEGQKALQETAAKIKATQEELRKDAHIPWELMMKPVDL